MHKFVADIDEVIELHPRQKYGGGYTYSGGWTTLPIELPKEFSRMSPIEWARFRAERDAVPDRVREALERLPVGECFSFGYKFDTQQTYEVTRLDHDSFEIVVYEDEA